MGGINGSYYTEKSVALKFKLINDFSIMISMLDNNVASAIRNDLIICPNFT